MGLGRLLLPVMRHRAQRILTQGLPPQPSALDWLLLAGLIGRHQRRGTVEELAPLHRWLWTGPAALSFHEIASERFERWWRPHHSRIAEPIRRGAAELDLRILYEIGCGCGRVLDDLLKTVPQLSTGIGIDLCHDQVLHNRLAFHDLSKLSFVSADAVDWIPLNAQRHAVFFTNAGVLEYIPAEALRQLLRHTACHCAPCGFAIVEPLGHDFDLDREIQTRVYGAERSLCHPYPHYFREAGFQIRFQEEQQVDGFRWLLLMGTAEGRSDGCAEGLPEPRPSAIT